MGNKCQSPPLEGESENRTPLRGPRIYVPDIYNTRLILYISRVYIYNTRLKLYIQQVHICIYSRHIRHFVEISPAHCGVIGGVLKKPRFRRFGTLICGDDHQAFSRNCPIFKRETEINQIQTKERIPRLPARRKLLRVNPHPKLIFSNAVKNTSNRTTAKSLSTSEQESQSESSEENLPPLPSYGHGNYTDGNGKNKRSPPSLPLTVGGVRRKRPRK